MLNSLAISHFFFHGRLFHTRNTKRTFSEIVRTLSFTLIIIFHFTTIMYERAQSQSLYRTFCTIGYSYLNKKKKKCYLCVRHIENRLISYRVIESKTLLSAMAVLRGFQCGSRWRSIRNGDVRHDKNLLSIKYKAGETLVCSSRDTLLGPTVFFFRFPR